MNKDEARKIVEGAFGRRPDLPSGKDFVDEVRHGKPPPDQSRLLTTPELWDAYKKHKEKYEVMAAIIEQDAKTASIKDAEIKQIYEECGQEIKDMDKIHQARIETLIKKIRRKVMNTTEGTSRAARNDLLAFFEQLKATHTTNKENSQ